MTRWVDRRRQETIEEIKVAARSQLEGGGTPEVSMRGIARRLDMTASAVHCYFPSRQALLDALIVDGFTSLAGVVRTAFEEVGPGPPGEQWLAVCRAHWAWAMDHQAEYLLLYGPDGASALKRNPQADQAFSGVVSILFSVMRVTVAAGEIDTERIEAATPASLSGQLAAWRDGNGGDSGLPVGALAACMITYTQLHGAVTWNCSATFQRRLPITARSSTWRWRTRIPRCAGRTPTGWISRKFEHRQVFCSLAKTQVCTRS
jgi:AcrR family transcriptional regulator